MAGLKDPLLYSRLTRIEGPLVSLQVGGQGQVAYGERAVIEDPQGRPRHGRVVALDNNEVVLEIFQGTEGLGKQGCFVRFLGEPMKLDLSPEVLGRRFNGIGEPIDGGPPLKAAVRRTILGDPINPAARDYPKDFIQTGISAIDGMNALVRGQKLPIFSTSGLAHDQLAIQIARQAKIRPDLSGSGEDATLVIVFAAIGVKHDVAARFAQAVGERMVAYLNLADDPPMERLLTPRVALTCAEYLAFDLGMHVLVILTDMTNYAEALREIATARGEVPSRKGYPGYLYSDLASIFERAGRIKGKKGSITQMPILTMPNNDITHPIPDLTGYITEGQIVLSPEIARRGFYPPVDLLPSLSRLMKDGVGENRTREDHFALMSQLYAAYARGHEVRLMCRVIGEEDLSELDRLYLRFAERFETGFLCQGVEEERTIEQTLDLGWQCLGCLPETELRRLSRQEIEAHRHLLRGGEAE